MLIIKSFFSKSGATLIELLVAAALSLLIATFALSSFSGLHYKQQKLDQNLNSELGLTKLYELFQKIINDFDQHRLKLYPKIHPAGIIQLHNGTELTFGNPANQPNPKSQAISYLQIDTLGILKVQRESEQVFTLCPIFKQTLDNQKLKAFIGVSNNKLLYLQAENYYLPKNHCWQSRLKSSPSLYLPEDPAEIPFLIYVIPVYEDYTIYLSNSGMLRFLGLRGQDILENQPLVVFKNMNFHISEESILKHNFYSLNLKIFKETQAERQFNFHSRLRRHDFYTFIFNLRNAE